MTREAHASDTHGCAVTCLTTAHHAPAHPWTTYITMSNSPHPLSETSKGGAFTSVTHRHHTDDRASSRLTGASAPAHTSHGVCERVMQREDDRAHDPRQVLVIRTPHVHCVQVQYSHDNSVAASVAHLSSYGSRHYPSPGAFRGRKKPCQTRAVRPGLRARTQLGRPRQQQQHSGRNTQLGARSRKASVKRLRPQICPRRALFRIDAPHTPDTPTGTSTLAHCSTPRYAQHPPARVGHR